MITRRLLRSVVAAVLGVAGLGVLSAASASATTTSQAISCTASNTYNVTLGVGDILEMTRDNTCASFSHSSGTGIWTLSYFSPNNSVRITTIGTGSGAFTFQDTSSSPTYVVVVNLTVTDGSSDSAAVEPVPASLTLAVWNGVSCREGASIAAFVGEWLTMPTQSDCTVSGDLSRTLLGWSTSPTLPTSIAQRQADNGWGTYEMTAADGSVVAVFIPAGHQTFVTGNNTLFPIWSR